MADDPDTGTVAFDYIKSQLFRVIHADGAIGSLTPAGLVHFALYSERPAIPRRIVQKMTPEGGVGDVVMGATETRNSIVREMDVDVILTIDVAKSLRDWLVARIEEFDGRNNSPSLPGGDNNE